MRPGLEDTYHVSLLGTGFTVYLPYTPREVLHLRKLRRQCVGVEGEMYWKRELCRHR